MKAFVINLERSVKRHAHMMREMGRMDLEFEFVEAVDGGGFSDGDIAAVADPDTVKNYPGWANPRMIATTLSHRKVFKRILDQGLDSALVLEDDVCFDRDIEFVVESLEKIVMGSEVVLLHYFSFAELELSTVGAIKVAPDRQALYPMFLQGVVSGAAYVITREAARKLYESTVPVKTASDSWFDFVSDGRLDRVRVVYAMPVRVIGAKSTISVATQSALRARLTEFVEEYEIPILHRVLRRGRLANVESMSKFVLTGERSPLDSFNC